jgi:hypothetical protein
MLLPFPFLFRLKLILNREISVQGSQVSSIYQHVAVCSRKRYRMMVYGQLQGPPQRRGERRGPKCYMQVCDSITRKCSRSASLRPGIPIRVSKTFMASLGQTYSRVEVIARCPRSPPGSVHKIFIDTVAFEPPQQATIS